VKQVLVDDFSRVSPAVAQQVCEMAKVSPRTAAEKIHGEELERLHKALGEVKVMAPPATAVVPIGEALLIEGLKRRFSRADFYVSTTRPPKVYRGNPFVVEVALAYGGELPADEPAEVMRFANRVPLQYQPKACAISESVYQTNWRGYELQQPKGSLPIAPIAVVVHLASVWVPFTSEAKEAVAHYDELLGEMKLALQECGRKLAAHLRARAHEQRDAMRRSLFEKYIPEVAQALSAILGVPKEKTEKPFYKALPSFVRFADDGKGEPEEDAKAGGGDGPKGDGEGGDGSGAKAGKGRKAPKAAAKTADVGAGAEPAKAAKPAKGAKAAKGPKAAAEPAPEPAKGGKRKRGEQLTLVD
jgi:DNA topoisomerase VI subunit B